MSQLTRRFKLNNVPKDFDKAPFGRQIEHLRTIQDFKASAKVVHISQKRKTSAAAIKEFKDLYQPSEFYCEFHDSADCRDDSFPVYYKTPT